MEEKEQCSKRDEAETAAPIRSLGRWVCRYPLRTQASGSFDRWDCLDEIRDIRRIFPDRPRVMCARKGPRRWVSKDRATRLRLRLQEKEGESSQNKAACAAGAILLPPNSPF